MTKFELTAALANSLAWPLVVGWAIWVLRVELRDLLRRLKYLALWSFRLNFREEAQGLSEKSLDIEIESRQWGDSGGRDLFVELEKDAKSNPEAAVLAAWQQVRSSLDSLAGISLDSSRREQEAEGQINDLMLNETISSDFGEVLRGLIRLRSYVYDGGRIDSEGAVQYIQTASRMDQLLSTLEDYRIEDMRNGGEIEIEDPNFPD